MILQSPMLSWHVMPGQIRPAVFSVSPTTTSTSTHPKKADLLHHYPRDTRRYDEIRVLQRTLQFHNVQLTSINPTYNIPYVCNKLRRHCIGWLEFADFLSYWGLLASFFQYPQIQSCLDFGRCEIAQVHLKAWANKHTHIELRHVSQQLSSDTSAKEYGLTHFQDQPVVPVVLRLFAGGQARRMGTDVWFVKFYALHSTERAAGRYVWSYAWANARKRCK